MPSFHYPLLSVPRMASVGFDVSFNNSRCTISSPTRTIATGRGNGQLYYLDTTCARSHQRLSSLAHTIANRSSLLVYRAFPSAACATITDIDVSHERLVHSAHSLITRMSSRRDIHVISIMPSSNLSTSFLGCVYGKSQPFPFTRVTSSTTTRLLELVHTYVLAPSSTTSFSCARYFYLSWTTSLAGSLFI